MRHIAVLALVCVLPGCRLFFDGVACDPDDPATCPSDTTCVEGTCVAGDDAPDPAPFCGDGKVTAGEACDDGNSDNGDGCHVDCTEPVCGDGFTDAGEQCDDANDVDGDGCTECNLDGGGGAVCGDGSINGGEACDFAATPDTCNTDCTAGVCGDGKIDGDEACDDDNDVDGDGCTDCALDPPVVVPPVCGDAVVNGTEACDFAATADTCNTDCTAGTCGDGKLDGDEDCDDGNGDADDGCTACALDGRGPVCGDGIVNGAEACDFLLEPDFCNTDCTDGSCGDGLVDGNEECDDGNAFTDDGCAGCALRGVDPVCGDGVVNGDEDCDFALDPDTCNTDCTDGACPDNKIDGDEECDDGNAIDDDGCADCLLTLPPPPGFCGDGSNDDEPCDASDPSETAACNLDCTLSTCGDAIVGPGEQCDDGANNARAIAGLDGIANQGTFEIDTEEPLPSLGWTAISGNPRVLDLVGNGVLVNGAADGLANYEVEHATSEAIRPLTTYSLHIDMGFVAGGNTGTTATFRAQLGTVRSGVFTPLRTKLGAVTNRGNLATGAGRDGAVGLASGSVDIVVVTASAVSGDPLAVRWAQTSNPGPNEFFGIDNVTLSQSNGCSSDCQVEVPFCGDGVVNAPDEDCDGALNCSAQCVFLRTACKADGTDCFGVSIPLASGLGEGPFFVRLRDMNRDGSIDIVGNSRFGVGATVLLGDGTGGFEAGRSSLSAAAFNSFLGDVADLDDDGFLDFISFGDNQYSVHYGVGDGSLSPGTPLQSAQCDDNRDLTTGDVDGDGKADDVVFISRNFSGSHNFRSDGGRPTPPLTVVQQFVPSNAVPSTSAGRLGDFDGDGILDLVLANDGFTGVGATLGNGQLAFQRGNGDGTFANGVVASELTGRAIGNVEVADIDGDGDLDAVALGVASGPLVFFGDGTGRFPTLVTLPPPAGVAGTTRIAIGDFTADGQLDIVTLDDVRAVFYAATAPRSFGVPFSRTLPAVANDLALADVDGDGLDDVVTTHSGAHTFNVLLSRPAP